MKWKIEYLHNAGIIFTVVTGNVTTAGINELSVEQLDIAKKHTSVRFLSDYRNASIGVSIHEIYDLPQMLRELGQTSKERFAVIYAVDSPDTSGFRFLETRCFNTCLDLKVFTDYDAAFRWLVT